MQLHQETGYLYPTAPFDFQKSLTMLKTFVPMQDEQVLNGQTVTKAIYAGDRIIVFQLTDQGSIDQPRLGYTLYAEQPFDEATIAIALDRISFFLSLDDDLVPFYDIARQDSEFIPVMETLYGYHQVKFITPFASACWASLAQRNLRNTTLRMKQALRETYGGRMIIDDVAYNVFPEARQLAGVEEGGLLLAVRNTRKAEYLYSLVQAFNSTDETFLRTGSYDEIDGWLRSIKGFGEWSSTFILLRGLGKTERVPLSEKATIEAASRLYGHGQDLSRKEVARLGEPYAAYQGYWAHYLRLGA
ncbi:MAG TPA: hypothetical protein VL461_15395 [Dictyobacter sp.]|jgi:DNA-3-methyladenine glycosylase II|nr:hypothetical protein [Dictyobacter sp.]